MRIEQQYDIASDDGRLHYLQEVCDFLSGLGTLEQEVYSARIADKLKIEKSAVLSQAQAAARRKRFQEQRQQFREMAQSTAGVGNRVNPERSTHLKGAIAEEAFLRLLLTHSELVPKAAEKIKPEEFVTEFDRRVYEQMLAIADEGQEVSVTLLAQQFSEGETAEIVRIVNSGEGRGTADFDRLIEVIREESTRPTPRDAAHLSADELLKQMKRLKQRKS